MYQFAYDEFVSDSGAEARDREAAAFDQAIALLRRAAEQPESDEARDALRFNDELWLILIDDLSHPENRLDEATRASLISIGIWMLKEADCIRAGGAFNFHTMADVNQMIRDGLK